MKFDRAHCRKTSRNSFGRARKYFAFNILESSPECLFLRGFYGRHSANDAMHSAAADGDDGGDDNTG